MADEKWYILLVTKLENIYYPTIISFKSILTNILTSILASEDYHLKKKKVTYELIIRNEETKKPWLVEAHPEIRVVSKVIMYWG